MKKTFLILILLLAFAATIVRVNAQEERDGIVTTMNEAFALDTGASVIAAKFIKQINILNKVTLNDGVFEDASFTSLIDKSEVIPDEEAGRANPFAPF